ncbi:unnamed protein product [Protopolystoma xenopodis]|uniref:Uncharacterized protein n=1 Tax=Protopolystoma xenopodis TaxID=117903 RepID=A0A3S5A0P1_9PLAT|nr:unnamed protein product [Protopolystoma xenopodis]
MNFSDVVARYCSTPFGIHETASNSWPGKSSWLRRTSAWFTAYPMPEHLTFASQMTVATARASEKRQQAT